MQECSLSTLTDSMCKRIDMIEEAISNLFDIEEKYDYYDKDIAILNKRINEGSDE